MILWPFVMEYKRVILREDGMDIRLTKISTGNLLAVAAIIGAIAELVNKSETHSYIF